jgi:(p)ppGpp synthase/HD superfamily hydrolase
MRSDFANWAIQKHRDTNHLYDSNLPYEFHLEMVVREVEEYCKKVTLTRPLLEIELVHAAWGHDLIEDCRVSYNDIIKEEVPQVADIIYACTNNKGKSRSERADTTYYKGIRATPGASIVKVCDRIANVKYGVLTGSRMPLMYKAENAHFKKELMSEETAPLFRKLDRLFNLDI